MSQPAPPELEPLARLLENAIVLPSGESAGHRLADGLSVTRRTAVPSALAM
jgi:hypothetical protein